MCVEGGGGEEGGGIAKPRSLPKKQGGGSVPFQIQSYT